MAQSDKPLAQTSRAVLLKHTPAQLWPLLSATDKLNREWGLPSVIYTPKPNPRGGSDLSARAKVFGMNVQWEEQPYEWIEPAYWQVKREYSSGPIRIGIFKLELTTPAAEAQSAGTLATYSCQFLAASPFTRWLIPYMLKDWFGKAVAAARAADEFLDKKQPSPFMQRYKKAIVNKIALDSAAENVAAAGTERKLIERLVDDLVSLPDEDVVRMRPFDAAARWGASRKEVLVLFMRSVRAGILDLTWQTICPHCRGAATGSTSLRLLRRQSRCEFCNIDFQTEFDCSVEARFTVNAAIRKAPDALYCVGGPGKTPHIHAQIRLDPGTTRAFSLDLKPGTYRVRGTQARDSASVIIGAGDGTPVLSDAPAKDSASHLKMSVSDDGFEGARSAAPGRVGFELNCVANAHIDVKVEKQDWVDNAATGVMVTAVPEFQDLATRDVLCLDEELAVKSVALLFTDLRGSTALYRQLGDAAAYPLVRQHFRVMEKTIQQSGGGIVKTIGDAVMAVFATAAEALGCCFEIQKAFMELWKQYPETAAIVVKLGFHRGPCIAVNLNERIDYFGTTVNIAARVQNESKGGDIVFPHILLADQSIQDVLQNYSYNAMSYNTVLKGIGDDTRLVRLIPEWGGKTLPEGTTIISKTASARVLPEGRALAQ